MAITLETVRQTLQTAVQTTSADIQNGLKDVLRETLRSLETPAERLWDIMFFPHQNAVVRAGIEMGLFRTLNEHAEQGACTVAELAKQVPSGGAHHLLVARLLRMLAGMGIVEEVAFEKYENLGVGELWQRMCSSKAVRCDEPVCDETPRGSKGAWLEESLWRTCGIPKSFRSGNEHIQILGWSPIVPGRLQQPYGRAEVQPSRDWFEFFPVEKKLLGAIRDDSAPLLVDVGGAQGFELQQFKKKYPDAKGRLILQDLPGTIESISELEEDIIAMKHDFFTPQPVKGARAYYFRSIFHDWDDDNSRKILRNLKPAMTPGYSTLLINDWILPDTHAPLYPSMLDINMMAGFSSMERTEKQWNTLLESEGFRVVKFWSVPGNEGCIEAELV